MIIGKRLISGHHSIPDIRVDVLESNKDRFVFVNTDRDMIVRSKRYGVLAFCSHLRPHAGCDYSFEYFQQNCISDTAYLREIYEAFKEIVKQKELEQ